MGNITIASHRKWLLLVVIIFSTVSGFSQTWTGSVSTAWETAGNWSTNAIPTTSTDVTIPSSPSGGRFPTISTGTLGTRMITIQSGASVSQTGGTLQVAGEWRNNGNFIATNGTVQFTGTGALIGGSVPTAFPAIQVTTGTITLNTNASCSSLTIANNAVVNSFTLSTGISLNCSGDVIINQASGGGVAHAFNPNAGFATIGGDLVFNVSTNTNGRTTRMAITSGTVSVNGNIKMNNTSAAANSAIDMSGGAGSLFIGGNFTFATLGTFTAGTSSTVIYNGTVNQNIAALTYRNLRINKAAGTASLVANLTIAGELNMEAGQLSTSASNFMLSVGSLNISNGTIAIGASVVTINGDVTATGGVFTNTTGNITVTGNWQANGVVTIPSNMNILFAGAAKTISGNSSTTFGNILFNAGSSYAMNNSNSCNSLTMNSGSSASSLTLANGIHLNITSSVSINQPTAGVAHAWNINSASVSVGGNLSIGGTATNTSYVSRVVITSGTLNVSGNVIYNSAVGAAATAVIDMSGGAGVLNIGGSLSLLNGTGTLTAGSESKVVFNGTGNQSIHAGSSVIFAFIEINKPSGIVSNVTNVQASMNMTLTSGTYTTNNFHLYLGGSWINNGGTYVWSGSNDMVLFYGSGILAGTQSTTFGNLSMYGSGSVDLKVNTSCRIFEFYSGSGSSDFNHDPGVSLTVFGNAVIRNPNGGVSTNSWNINEGSAFVEGNLLLGSGEDKNNNRIALVNITSGELTIDGDLILQATASRPGNALLDMTGGSGRVNVKGAVGIAAGSWSGTIAPGTTGTFNFNGTASQTISFPSQVKFNNILINNPAGVTAGANFTSTLVSGDIHVQSGTFNNGGFAIAGAATKTFEVANGATFNISGTSGMVTDFNTKTFNQSSFVEYSGTTQTVSEENYGNLTISGARGLSSITYGNGNNIGIAGNFTNTATFLTGGHIITGTTFVFNGTAAQNISSFTFNNLTISKASGLAVLTGNVTVNNNLTFTTGKIQTGINRVIIATTGSVIGAAQATGWVSGNLQKSITIGSNVIRTFEVGNDANYSPVTTNMALVSTASSLIAGVLNGDHSYISSSPLEPTKSLNKYWNFKNNGVVFTTATLTFNWQPSDLDSGVTTSELLVAALDAVWNSPTVSNRTATSIQANNILLLNQFIVAEVKCARGTWIGNFGNLWSNPLNWSCGIVPDSTIDVVIPSGRPVYPVVTLLSAAGKNISINTGASLTVSDGTFSIFGAISNAGTFTANDATIELKGTAAQTIAANTFAGNTLKNLTVKNAAGVTLNGELNLTNVLTITEGSLNSGGFLILKSTANNTALVATITSASATPIIGNVVVERYVPGRRKYRLITSSVNTSPNNTLTAGQEAQSIWGNWQMSGSTAQQNKGTSITGGTVADGYDQITSNASLFTYNPATSRFVAFSSANGKNTKYTPLKAGVPYYMFVYGDRQNSASASMPRPTVLTATGTLNTGDQVYSPSTSIALSTTTGMYTLMGNPYASIIDWKLVQLRDISRTLWTWDPNLSSTGGFVTISSTSAGDIVSPLSDLVKMTRFVQPGQGFFVRTTGSLPLITIKESHKASSINNLAFRNTGDNEGKLIAINLLYNSASTPVLADGVVAAFDPGFSNNQNEDDAVKIPPTVNAELVTLVKNGVNLSIETRDIPTVNDTLFLNTVRLSRPQYTLQVLVKNLASTTMQPYLEDKFLNTKIPLMHTDTNYIPFNVDVTNALTSAPDRFKITFSPTVTLPVSFANTTAEAKGENVQVDWNVVTENGITKYEVLKSTTGSSFYKIGEVAASQNTSTISSYKWIDENVDNGSNYYQVKAIQANGSNLLSKVVMVRVERKGKIKLITNPIQNQQFSVLLNDLAKDSYKLEILNVHGQVLVKQRIDHKGGTSAYKINLGRKLPSGVYTLKISNGSNTFSTPIVAD